MEVIVRGMEKAEEVGEKEDQAIVEIVLDKGENYSTVTNLFNQFPVLDTLSITEQGVYNSKTLPFKYFSVASGMYSLPPNAVAPDMIGKTGLSLNNRFPVSVLRQLEKLGITVHWDRQFIEDPEVAAKMKVEAEKLAEKLLARI